MKKTNEENEMIATREYFIKMVPMFILSIVAVYLSMSGKISQFAYWLKCVAGVPDYVSIPIGLTLIATMVYKFYRSNNFMNI